MQNTVKTLGGHILRMSEKYLPLGRQSESLDGVFNYIKINEKLSTSGQPTEHQFRLIKDEGFTTIVNLAPVGVIENSLKSEPQILEELGFEYIHIPVVFSGPTEEQFATFTDILQKRADEKVWVHCAVNARVSAFMYRYRCNVLGEEETVARADMEKVWEPMGVWKTFIANPGFTAD